MPGPRCPFPRRPPAAALALLLLPLATASTPRAGEPAAGEERQAESPDRFPRVARGELPRADGFRGIWYANQPVDSPWRYKYSGGLATYPQQHHPIAVHDARAGKTFFVWGGRARGSDRLLHTVSFYDHRTGRVARPRVLLDKGTSDAHDNPTLAQDGDGRLWIFSNAHGTARPAYIHRGREPRSIEAFDLVLETNFSYGQPWWLEDHGFLLLHTRYVGGRRLLHEMRSPDGRSWSEPRLIAAAGEGHYQVSWRHEGRVATAFNLHPEGRGLNWRTNLYYLETPDGGATWTDARSREVDLPLREPENAARILDLASSGRLAYLKCLRFDGDGRPIVVFLTARGWRPGAESGPRVLRTARWTGERWDVREAACADNNYDFATLHVDADGVWRLLGALGPGPQRWNTGGEMALLVSRDRGATWSRRQLTRDSPRNHNYPRLVLGAAPGFHALWADGHGRERSSSRLWFADREGTRLFRLPATVEGDTARPEEIAPADPPQRAAAHGGKAGGDGTRDAEDGDGANGDGDGAGGGGSGPR